MEIWRSIIHQVVEAHGSPLYMGGHPSHFDNLLVKIINFWWLSYKYSSDGLFTLFAFHVGTRIPRERMWNRKKPRWVPKATFFQTAIQIQRQGNYWLGCQKGLILCCTTYDFEIVAKILKSRVWKQSKILQTLAKVWLNQILYSSHIFEIYSCKYSKREDIWCLH